MTEQPTIAQAKQSAQDNIDRAIRTAAIDCAIRSNCGQSYDEEGRQIVDASQVIQGAIKFEKFIRGEITLEDLYPQQKKPEKKENW
jgi:hypothetical protein